MNKSKKIVALTTVIMIMGTTAVTAFAAPGNPGVPAKDGTGRGAGKGAGQCQGTGMGQGANGGQGLGIGGLKLQDGSCYQ